MESTYNDPAKSLARQKLAYFIQKNVFPYRKPHDVRVACFPGAEKEGEEALEVREVYDSLRIPRENIVGIECVPEIAQRLRSANLGIQVIQSTAKDFFHETDLAPFDVISLDYKGQQTLNEAATLEAITSRQLLNEHGVLATTHFAGRESPRMRKLLAARYLEPQWRHQIDKAIVDGVSTYEINAEYTQVLNDVAENAPIDKLRQGMVVETAQIMGGGTVTPPIRRHFFIEEKDYAWRKERLARNWRKNQDSFAREQQNLNGLSIERNLKMMEESEEDRLNKTLYGLYYANFERNLAQDLGNENAEAVLSLYMREFNKSYVVQGLECYKYTSNKGSPMLVDLFTFTHLPGDVRTLLKKAIKLSITNGKVDQVYNPMSLSERDYKKTLEKLCQRYRELRQFTIPVRIPLVPAGVDASAQLYEPSQEEKCEIYRMLRSGISEDEILSCFDITDRQLGAYRAWVTMQERNQKSSNAAGK